MPEHSATLLLQVLPSPTAASEWPAFVLDPPPQPHNRSSLLPYRVPPGVATGVEPLVEPLSVPRNAHHASLPNRHSFFVPFLAVAAVLLVALAVVGILLRLWLRASRRYDELQRAALSHRRHARPLGNSKVCSTCVWCKAMQRILHSDTNTDADTVTAPWGPSVRFVGPPDTPQALLPTYVTTHDLTPHTICTGGSTALLIWQTCMQYNGVYCPRQCFANRPGCPDMMVQ